MSGAQIVGGVLITLPFLGVFAGAIMLGVHSMLS